jgi:hypothetical protein
MLCVVQASDKNKIKDYTDEVTVEKHSILNATHPSDQKNIYYLTGKPNIWFMILHYVGIADTMKLLRSNKLLYATKFDFDTSDRSMYKLLGVPLVIEKYLQQKYENNLPALLLFVTTHWHLPDDMSIVSFLQTLFVNSPLTLTKLPICSIYPLYNPTTDIMLHLDQYVHKELKKDIWYHVETNNMIFETPPPNISDNYFPSVLTITPFFLFNIMEEYQYYFCLRDIMFIHVEKHLINIIFSKRIPVNGEEVRIDFWHNHKTIVKFFCTPEEYSGYDTFEKHIVIIKDEVLTTIKVLEDD